MIVFLVAQGTNAYNRYAIILDTWRNLNDKNQQASSQKFRQLTSLNKFFSEIILVKA